MKEEVINEREKNERKLIFQKKNWKNFEYKNENFHQPWSAFYKKKQKKIKLLRKKNKFKKKSEKHDKSK